MEVGSTSLRAARTSTPRKMSWARIAGRFRPIWSARELVSQFPRYGRPTRPEPSQPERNRPWELAACAIPLEVLVLFPAFVSRENRPKSTGRPSGFPAHPPRGRFVLPEVHHWHRGAPAVRENRPCHL